MQEVAKCPKGHGLLKKDRDGYLICPVFCGYEKPPKELPTEEQESIESKGYEYKGRPAVRAGQGFRYPEAIKIKAVRDAQRGIDKTEICKKVGCASITLDAWIAKYGKAISATHINVLKGMLGKANGKREIKTLGQAIKILEEAKE